MSRHPRALLVLWVVTAVLALLPGGCGRARVENPTGPDVIQLRQIPDELKADLDPVVEANTAFALSLYARLREDHDNLFFSPYSISTALAMTWAGARARTEAEMAATLHFTLPQERLHPIFGALQSSLETGAGQGGYRLNIANRLWGQTGFPWEAAFLELMQNHYGAGLQNLDFAADPEACRQLINAWISERTAGKIPELLETGILDELTRMVLTNAIYFKGKWQYQFNAASTRDGDFTLSSGEVVQVPMMEQEGKFEVSSDEQAVLLRLPYAGRDLSMLFLMPVYGHTLTQLEAGLSPAELARRIENLHETTTFISLPRFRVTSEFNLKQALQELGMPAAFDPDSADFSGLDGHRDLFLQEAVHKAFVEVNEEGTEAAAATGIITGTTSAGGVLLDHPFLFLIRDEVTKSILFLGRLADPR
jgi:serpin B